MNSEHTVQRTAVIDIGSNSIKLIIGEMADRQISILEFLKNIVPIGRTSFYTGAISSALTKQIITILDNYRRVIRQYDVGTVRVIATTAVREARNRDIFVDTLLRKTGFSVEVLTPGDVTYYADSYLSYELQKNYPLEERNILIAELGAGSLDISVMQQGLTLLTIGLPVGTLRLQQLMSKLDGSMAEINDIVEEYIKNEFSSLRRLLPQVRIDDVFLLDETYARYLPNMVPQPDDGSGQPFLVCQRQTAGKVLELLADKSNGEVQRLYSIPLEYAETMGAYAAVLNNLFELTENPKIHILETALAEAVLANVLLGKTLAERFNKITQLTSTARFLCQQFRVDFAHAQHVAGLVEILFNNLKGHLGLCDNELLYVLLAAYLHDVGMFIHNRAHHKHSEYIISNIGLFRLTEDEMRVIACIARYHRKALPRPDHECYSMLSRQEQLLVQKLAALLRVANALDCSHRQKVRELEVEFSRNRDVTLVASGNANMMLEKLEFAQKKGFFEEITGSQLRLVIKD